MRHAVFIALAAVVLVGCQKKDEPQPSSAPSLTGTPGMPQPQPQPKGGNSGELTGTISGRPFKPDSVKLVGNKLSFRKGKDFFADAEIEFDLPKGDGKFEGKEWTFTGDKFENPSLLVAAREGVDGVPKTEFVFPADYSMTLKITKQTSKVIEGTIDLKVTKPANTSLSGAFSGIVEKTASDPLDADDAPYIQGKIILKGEWKEESMTAGFVGKTAEGKTVTNSAGTKFQHGGGGWVSNTSFKPQITSVVGEKDGVVFKHTHLKPGEYWLYVKRAGVLAAWQTVAVKEGDQLKAELVIDPAKEGSVIVTIPEEEANSKDEPRLELIRQDLKIPGGDFYFFFDAADVKKGQKSVTVPHVPAGKYIAKRGDSEAMVEVVAGKEAAVTLVSKKKTDK